jgi:hypothetical protein
MYHTYTKQVVPTDGGLDREGLPDGFNDILGDSEGDKLGASDGISDGSLLGNKLGISDGKSLGNELGIELGFVVRDGADDGTMMTYVLVTSTDSA